MGGIPPYFLYSTYLQKTLICYNLYGRILSKLIFFIFYLPILFNKINRKAVEFMVTFTISLNVAELLNGPIGAILCGIIANIVSKHLKF